MTSQTPLHIAACTGSEETVRILLNEGADVKATDKDGRTPLHDAAACAGSEVTVGILLDRGADVKAADKDGRTPLHDAAACAGSGVTVYILLNKGADVKATDKDGRTPLHEAARAGLGVTVYILLNEGADVKATDKNGRTPLHNAACTGSEETVRILLNEGADVKATDKDGRTPLHDAAACAGSEVTVDILLDRGADVKAADKDGRTPLHDAAACAGSGVTVHILLNKGADIKATDKDGRTPLHEAARAGLGVTVFILLNEGADVKAADKNGRTPLHNAACTGSEETVRILLNKGADVKATDKDGRTPLHDAARASLGVTVYKFHSKGTDLKATNKDGQTTLLNAAPAGLEDTVCILLDKGADVKAADKDGRTPLHDAACAGSGVTVRILLEKGADVKATDKDGRTPLHDAACAGSGVTVRILLEKGADVKAVDKDGRTPLHDATCTGSEETVCRLLNEGADVKATDKDGRTPLHDAVSRNLAGLTCLLVHLSAETCNLNEYGLLTLRQSFSTLYLLKAKYTPLLAVPESIVQYFSLHWNGLRTYEECKGNIGDVLTISRTKPQGHSYIARSVSEHLADIYPHWGSHLLEFITRICAISLHTRGNQTSKLGLLSQTRHLQVPPYREPKKFVDELLAVPSSKRDGVIITGIFEAPKLTLIVSAQSKASMSIVKSALTWMLAVLQPRPENVNGLFYLPLDENFLDTGIPEPTEFKPGKLDRYCWMELFTYAVIMGNIPAAEAANDAATEGLEIELDLLVELAAVDRQTTIKGGVTMMYGFDTAIMPLAPAEARRWHFITTKGRQITPSRAENELTDCKVDTILLASQYLPGKVYIGWCPNPVVGICSEVLKTFANEVIKPSGVQGVEKLEEQPERSAGKDFSFSPRLGFLGSSLGFSTGIKREEKYKRIVVISARTRESDFEGVLTSAMGTPSILWDSRNQRASLLPVISVLAFASLRYVEWQEYSFQREQNGKLAKAGIYYSIDMKNSGDEARVVLRRNSSLLVDTAKGEPVSGPLTFQDIARDIWERMCDGEDLCVDELSGVNREDKEDIFGYDLSEAMLQKRVQLRKLHCLPAMRSWIPLCQGHRLQVIFSRYVGEVLSCGCDPAVSAGQQPAKGTLTCLLDDLRLFYGARWSMLAQDSCSNGLPIGEKFEWIPRYYVLEECHSSCSRRIFQTITEKQSKKLKKNTSNSTRQERHVDASTFRLPSGQCLIRFG